MEEVIEPETEPPPEPLVESVVEPVTERVREPETDPQPEIHPPAMTDFAMDLDLSGIDDASENVVLDAPADLDAVALESLELGAMEIEATEPEEMETAPVGLPEFDPAPVDEPVSEVVETVPDEAIAIVEEPRVRSMDPDELAAADLGLVEAMPRISQQLRASSPDTAYGFDIDLGAAADIPLVTSEHVADADAPVGDVPADPPTTEFGFVDVPDDRAFGELATDEAADPLLELVPEPTPEIGVDAESTPDLAVTPVALPALESLPSMRDMPTPIVPHTPVEVFATETMAELYVQQGLRHEAIGVYRQLVAARPNDEGLRAKLAALEAPRAPAAPPTARSFFAGLAARRAARQSRASAAAVAGAPRATPTPSAALPAAPAPRDFLNELFGAPSVSASDERAADSLASAFDNERASAAPAAADDRSLDRVFNADDERSRAP